jgi:hypothetical protein
MYADTEKFEVIYKEKPAKIEVISVGGQTLYKVIFDEKPGLFVTRAKHFNANKFWTSVPEGKQQLAEEIGVLIEQHYKMQS